MQFILTQCAVLGIALGAGDPPPLASYNFGITGEPTKDDTAFGNLGEIGPVYNVPEARNDSSATSGGNPQIGKPVTTTESPKIVQPTTIAPTGKLNSSNAEEFTTIKTTYGEKITLPGQGSSLNGTTSAEESSGSSTIPSSTQAFETTTISKDQETSITTESGNNTTSNTNVTTAASKIPEGLSNPSSPSSPSTTSSTSSSTPTPTQGETLQTTPNGPPSQTFHTGSPNSTDAPTIPPSHNETEPGQNSTIPSKPSSSMSLYPNNGNLWLTLAAASVYIVNVKST